MQVILIAAISADGKIAEKLDQSSLDWTSKEDTKFFVEQTKAAGTVIMGRKTFDTINKALKDRRVIVLTKTPATHTPPEGVEYTSEEPEILYQRLVEEGCQSVVLGGGSSVYSQFLEAGLVDEVYLTVEPVLFGNGVPLTEGFGRIKLKLEQIKQLNSQSVLLHYLVVKE